MQPGYEKTAQLCGVFDARQFVIRDPTLNAARAALVLLEELLTEFHFVAATDKAAAPAAIFSAVVRPTLAHAPAFHVQAPVFGWACLDSTQCTAADETRTSFVMDRTPY